MLPPLMSHGFDMQFRSWSDTRLPEMLWAVLLVVGLKREHALEIFRLIASIGLRWRSDLEMAESEFSLGHSGFFALPEGLSAEVLEVLAGDSEVRRALRPLLLCSDLPGWQPWREIIGEDATDEDWEALKRAVGLGVFHQSQEATDVRWLRLFFHLGIGKLHYPSEEKVREVVEYPNFGDQRKVRPSIRAGEIALAMGDESDVNGWPTAFWKHCLASTGCEVLVEEPDQPSTVPHYARQSLELIRIELINCFFDSLDSTEIDAKHDTVFGTAFYALGILDELLAHGIEHSITGRFALRAIFEAYVTLAYLDERDDAGLWKSYRVYGAGQAKLALLKLEEGATVPEYVNVDELEGLANEDMWQEFVSIELGHWTKSNLRSLSEGAGIKDVYDRYYPWTSTYVHGHWGALRDSSFQICVNPLHRFHRIPRVTSHVLPDVLEDASDLLDRILELVATVYPVFSWKPCTQ